MKIVLIVLVVIWFLLLVCIITPAPRQVIHDDRYYCDILADGRSINSLPANCARYYTYPTQPYQQVES